MKFFKSKLLVIVLGFTVAVSCGEPDNVIYDVFDGLSHGAVLRTKSLDQGTFNAFDPTSEFIIQLEAQDERNGKLLESVDVYASFVDNKDDGLDNNKAELLHTNIPASSFSEGDNGLPVTTFSVSLGTLSTLLGLAEADYDGGDRFVVRFELKLTDGRTFSVADGSGTLQGSYFASPYSYNVDLVCPVGETFAIGNYLISNTNSNLAATPVFGSDVTVAVTEGVTETQRTFSAVYLANLNIGNGPVSFTFDFVCGEVLVPDAQASGLGCGGNTIFFGPGTVNASYDPNDDAVITITMGEDQNGACAPVADLTFTLTKQ